MSLPLFNDAESQVSGTTVTTGNSGGGLDNAFNLVTIGASMALTFDSANPMHGVNAFKIDQLSTVTAPTYVTWDVTSFVFTFQTLQGSFYFRTPTAIASTIRLLGFANGTTIQGRLGCTNGLQGFQWRGGVAGDTAQGTISGTLTANTWYRVEWEVAFDVVSGFCNARIYTGDSTTLQGEAISSNLQFGVAPVGCNKIHTGVTTANWSSVADTCYVDDIRDAKPDKPTAPASLPLIYDRRNR
jgi:hypothetical protein